MKVNRAMRARRRYRHRNEVNRLAEKNANKAASRFVQGDIRLSRFVNPARAANFHLPGSASEQLPTALKEELGIAFGADLTPIRVHHDSRAQRAVQMENSRAFASGVHIYFGANQYQPDTMSGRELIAHEVTHVLQQTGRKVAEDNLEIIPGATGSGPVQHQGEPELSDDEPDESIFNALIDAYQRGEQAGDLENTMIEVGDLVEHGLVANPTRPRFAMPLVNAVLATQFNNRSGQSKGFVIDCLKILGFFPAAKYLIDWDGRLEATVIVHSSAFIGFLRSQNDVFNWAAGALWFRDFQRYWPHTIISDYRSFFLTPHAPPPAANSRIQTARNEAVTQRTTQNQNMTVLPQERVVIAWDALVEIDRQRLLDCQAIRGEVNRVYSDFTPTERLINGITNVKNREREILDSDTEPAWRKNLAESLLQMIERDIDPLWQRLQEDIAHVRAEFGAFTIAQLLDPSTRRTFVGEDERTSVQLPRFPARGHREPFVNQLHAVVLEHAQAIFAESVGSVRAGPDDASAQGAALGEGLPSPEDYQQRLTAFINAMEQSTRSGNRTLPSLFEQIDRSLRRRALQRRRNEELVRGLALMSWFTDMLVWQSQRYNQQGDEATPNFVDELGFHRLQLARTFLWFARWMGWQDIVDATKEALSAGTGLHLPQLWIRDEWRVDTDTSLRKLRQDFPSLLNEPFISEVPFTLLHIIRWFRLSLKRRLRSALLGYLASESTASANTEIDFAAINNLRQDPSAVQANFLANAEAEFEARARGDAASIFQLNMPQRFKVTDWDALIPPNSDARWDDMIYQHPKTQASIVRHKNSGAFHFAIVPRRVEQRVFLWILPSLQGLVNLARDLPSLRQVAGSQAANLGTFLNAIHRDNIDYSEWDFVNERINSALLGLIRPINREMPDLWRRFTTLQRRILTMQLKRRFAGYLTERRVTARLEDETDEEAGARIQAPITTIRDISRFRSNARPRDEADAQIALLVLTMAAEFDRLFSRRDQENAVARDYYQLFEETLQFSTPGNAENLQKLRRITNVYDELGGRIAYINRNLLRARAHLRNAQRTITENFAEAQSQIGFEGADHDGTTVIRSMAFRSGPIYPTSETNPDPMHQWHIGMTADNTGHIQEGSGNVVRVTNVARHFEYRPAVGSQGYGPYIPPLYKNSEGETFGGMTGRPIPHDQLFSIQIGEGTTARVVFADDDPALMTRYNDMFLWRGFQIHMENLAAVTQASMELLMDAVAMATGLVIPQVIAQTLQFVSSGDLEEMVRQLQDDPWSVAEQLVERIQNELLTPENIWKFLLLAGQHRNPLSGLLNLRSTRNARPAPPPRTRIGRVVRSLRLLGTRFHNAINRLRSRARGPIRSVQGNLAMRPTLSWVMRRAITVLRALNDLIPPEVGEAIARGDVPVTPDAIRDAVGESIEDITTDLRRNTLEILTAIEAIELPGELIDLTLATELIVMLVADRFGAKARIVRRALELIPVPQDRQGRFTGFKSLYTYMAEQIGDIWRDTALDPNRYWREDVLPLIGNEFVELRDQFVNDLYRTINRFLSTLGQAPLERPETDSLPSTEVIPETLETEASLQPGISNQSVNLSSCGWHLPRQSGIPFSSSLRQPYEQKFGQNFSHVRLHHGNAAVPATTPIGANAVTSGSHIFLNPKLSLNSPGVQPTLAHELTHVVQQTGSHPLSGTAPQPKWGRSGTLRFDHQREQQADRVSQSFSSGHLNMGYTNYSDDGVQPSITDRTMSSIIETLTEVGYDADAEQDFTADSTGPVPGIEIARRLWGEVWTKLGNLNTGSNDDFARFTQDPNVPIPGITPANVRDKIKTHLTRSRSFGDQAITGIATLAQKPIRQTDRNQPQSELKVSRFVNLLENFIFAEKGIGLQISVSRTEPRTIQNVKVINVALERIGGRSRLWKIAVTAGFTGRRIPIDARLQNGVRQRLRAMGPQARIWDSNEFKFSNHFVTEFVEIREQALRGNLTDVPTVANYKDTTNNRGDSLAVSTHGRLTRGRSIGTFNRESHHTTQYLLAEFFSNKHGTRKAFPAHHSRYPTAVKFANTTQTGGVVNSIDAPGRSEIKITALDPTSGRGDEMPAVLLSARTHQRGKLHVLSESVWNDNATMGFDTDNSSSQGLAIQNTFNRNLPVALRTRDGSEAHRQRFEHQLNTNMAGANRAFYDATVATYHWMYNRMIPALRNGLKTEELAYYRSIAAINHSLNPDSDDPGLEAAYNLRETDLNQVFRAAKRNNDQVMSRKGWPTP
ncbi:eCIS core domain-containing protein [Aliikangiella coralliicola]|uniref:DUF4157 domain-containing protein n=1 Tax=Aliikangiella coralliicola TaxID=2592383 RepID=A0A545UE81_9GAMM|nr:DUF4157 domain-containing protein [Aliikangiella coralliicola]TQV87768.1 DUF4157 domain-containing protein [Aliikangiella coralliicola]